jgi:hypothetical protein
VIRISPEQLRVLAAPQRAQLERELAELVLELYRDEAAALCGGRADAEALAGVVGELVERARGYGLHDDADVERFVELSFEYGPGFEREGELSWVGEILRGPSSSGTAKLVRIDDRLGGDE